MQGERVGLCLSELCPPVGLGRKSRVSEQTPEGGQEYEGQGQGPWGSEASTITEVVLAADGGGRMLGVAIVHGLEAAGHTGFAHLHLDWGVVCRGWEAGWDPERGRDPRLAQPQHARPLGQVPPQLERFPKRILEPSVSPGRAVGTSH